MKILKWCSNRQNSIEFWAKNRALVPVLLRITHWPKSGLPVSPPGLFPVVVVVVVRTRPRPIPLPMITWVSFSLCGYGAPLGARSSAIMELKQSLLYGPLFELKGPCFTTFPDTEKSIKTTTRNEVVLTNFEPCLKMLSNARMKHGEYLWYIFSMKTNTKKRK